MYTTSVDFTENKKKSSAQTQTRLGKTDTEEKTTIIPTTQLIKHPVTKSTKIWSKDKRSPIRPPASTDSSLKKKKTLKYKQNLAYPTIYP